MKYGYQDALALSGITEAHPGGFALTKKVMGMEKIRPGAIVLDAGCGMGLTSAYLAKMFKCKVFAVDAHPLMIEQATKKMKKERLSVKVVKGSIENLPFPDDSFDYIVAESSTIFTNIEKTLNEYYRVLKPSGVLIDSELCAETALTNYEEERIKDFYKLRKVPTEKEWISSLKKSRFTDIHIITSNTILNELKNAPLKFDDENHFESLDPAIEEILFEHSRLMMECAEQLGYRVFRGVKK